MYAISEAKLYVDHDIRNQKCVGYVHHDIRGQVCIEHVEHIRGQVHIEHVEQWPNVIPETKNVYSMLIMISGAKYCRTYRASLAAEMKF